MNAYDRLLEWASESGEGSWRAWRSACEYLDLEPSRAARRLSALGHLEFDFARDRFACTPPTAVLTLHSSGCVIVTGARRRGFREELEALFGDEESGFDIDLRPPVEQETGPETWLIEVGMADVVFFCEAARLDFQVDSGRRIARATPVASLESVGERERPDGRFPRRWLHPRLRTFDPEPVKGLGSDGLWWVEEYRREVAFVRRDGEWYRLAVREYGPYLAYPDTAFIRYAESRCFLVVDNETPLPPLLARALTLQSGRLPVPDGNSRHAYVNVDDELAGIVQKRLARRRSSGGRSWRSRRRSRSRVRANARRPSTRFACSASSSASTGASTTRRTPSPTRCSRPSAERCSRSRGSRPT